MDGDWAISHFSQSNPEGEGQGDVAALLRRVADSIESPVVTFRWKTSRSAAKHD